MELRIDAEFESKIPPLTEEEFMQLESNIVSNGIVINPIITWKGVIIDGHNRYRIIRKHPDIKFTTHEKAFIDRYEAIAWICKNQLGRRNLTLEQKKYLLGKQYEAEKASQGGLRNMELDQRGRFTAKCQVDTLREDADTSLRIAKENGISRHSVFRAEAFSKAVDIADEVEPGIRSELLSGKIKPSEKDRRTLTKAVPEERAALIKELRKPPKEKKKQDKPNISNGITLAQVRQIGKDMLHSKSRGTKEDMFYELEDAMDCMMFRWTHCLSANADYYAEPECRNKVNQITQAGLDYLKQVMDGEI